jgi:hypothetical protein
MRERMYRAALTLALLWAPLAWGAPADPQAIVERLTRSGPASIAFTEARFSPLLAQPLIVSGELGYNGPADLERRVRSPYREDTYIRGDSVRVQREDEPARSFALKRAPELRGLVMSLAALLGGDARLIGRDFRMSAQGSDETWTLDLVPIDARVRQRLEHIRITGRQDSLRCFAMINPGGGASVLLLGDLAAKPLPPEVTRESLARDCEDGGTPKSTLQSPGASSSQRGS